MALSVLLHAALLLLPYLGERRPEGGALPAKADGRTPHDPLLTVLSLDGKYRFSVTRPALGGDPVPEQEAVPGNEPGAAPQELPASSGTGTLPFDAKPFYQVEELSRRPQPTSTEELDTPELKPIVASGRIVLQLWITELGNVVHLEVEKSDLPGPFTERARQVFSRMRFTPGEREGVPVGTFLRIEVNYDDGRAPPP